MVLLMKYAPSQAPSIFLLSPLRHTMFGFLHL